MRRFAELCVHEGDLDHFIFSFMQKNIYPRAEFIHREGVGHESREVELSLLILIGEA